MKPRLLDLFCGEGGAGQGYADAGFDVFGVDTSTARLERYPFPHVQGDAIDYVLRNGHHYDAIHASPTCTGYSRGTAAIPDRVSRYDRLIPAVREALLMTRKPYVIENVADARHELLYPVLLCGRMFRLGAVDEDGAALVLDRHRLFESNVMLLVPEHLPHDKAVQVAGSYAGARRGGSRSQARQESRELRKGGYVPRADVQRALLNVPWMTEKGCQLSIPPAYTGYLGAQLMAHLSQVAP